MIKMDGIAAFVATAESGSCSKLAKPSPKLPSGAIRWPAR